MKSRSEKLKQSFQIAEEIMKKRAVSFYQAFCLLPKDRFLGITAIYAFCRYADDLGDGDLPKQEKESALEQLAENVRQLYLQEETDFHTHADKGWWMAFADTARKYEIDSYGFLNQIAGQRMDAERMRIQNMNELLEYCRLVAGSVGTMLAPLLINHEKYLPDHDFILRCEKLGIGMQITNILRDVGEDYRQRGRIYLPQDKLDEYGIGNDFFEQYIIKGQAGQEIPQAFIRLWEELAVLADEFYQEHEKNLEYFLPIARFPLIAAALSYRAIAEAVRRQKYNCLTQRCYTTAATRLKLIAKAKQMAVQYESTDSKAKHI